MELFKTRSMYSPIWPVYIKWINSIPSLPPPPGLPPATGNQRRTFCKSQRLPVLSDEEKGSIDQGNTLLQSRSIPSALLRGREILFLMLEKTDIDINLTVGVLLFSIHRKSETTKQHHDWFPLMECISATRYSSMFG